MYQWVYISMTTLLLVLAVLVSPLLGGPVRLELHRKKAFYNVDIWVGIPPRKQPMLIDTGSSLTTLICSSY